MRTTVPITMKFPVGGIGGRVFPFWYFSRQRKVSYLRSMDRKIHTYNDDELKVCRPLPRSRIRNLTKQALIPQKPPRLVERPRSIRSSSSLPTFLPLRETHLHRGLIPEPLLKPLCPIRHPPRICDKYVVGRVLAHVWCKIQTNTGVRLTRGACSPKNMALRVVCQRPPVQSFHRHRSIVPVSCRVEEFTAQKRNFGEKKLFVSGFLALSEASAWTGRSSLVLTSLQLRLLGLRSLGSP